MKLFSVKCENSLIPDGLPDETETGTKLSPLQSLENSLYVHVLGKTLAVGTNNTDMGPSGLIFRHPDT